MTDVSQKQWYIVHTYSGFEKKVAESLGQRVAAYGLQNEIGEIGASTSCPVHEVVSLQPSPSPASGEVAPAITVAKDPSDLPRDRPAFPSDPDGPTGRFEHPFDPRVTREPPDRF